MRAEDQLVRSPVMLITGASSGIGEELARAAAARGFDLVVVARRADRLRALAEDLHEAHGTRCVVIVEDLCAAGAVARIHETVQSTGRPVDVLVNNAGVASDGRFLDLPWEEHERILQLLVHAPAALAYRFLPSMLERGRGSIVNVASIAGLLPGTPFETMYGPAKHALVVFTRNLAEEYRGTGVRIAAVCPGLTPTGFTDEGVGAELLRQTPKALTTSARMVAESVLRASEQGRQVVIPGLGNRLAVAAARFVPAPVVNRVLGRVVGPTAAASAS